MSSGSRGLRWWATNVAAPAAITVALVAYVVSRRDDLASLADVPLERILLVAALAVVAHFLNAAEFGVLYRAVGAPLGVVENWMLFTAGQLGNHLPGQLGTLYRFQYLRTVHDLPYSRATAGYGANLVITVLATGLVGLVGSIALGLTEGTWSPLLLGGLAALVVIAVVAAAVPLPRWRERGRAGRAWAGVRDGWDRIRADRRAAGIVLALELIKYPLTAWRLQLTFGWLGFEEPYWFFLVIAPVSALATFVGFTPAALGFREAAITGTAVLLGRTFDAGLLGATIDRAVLLAVTVVLGAVGFAYTGWRLRRATSGGPSASAATESHAVAEASNPTSRPGGS